jgi:methionyl-tRNA synthetase
MFWLSCVFSAVRVISLTFPQANQTVTTIAPWSKETPPESAAAFVPLALETLRVSGVLLQPFLPNTAGTLLSALGVPAEQRTWAHAAFAAATVGDVRPVKLFAPRVKAEA